MRVAAARPDEPGQAGGLASWWRSGEGASRAYALARTMKAARWRGAAAALPVYEGPDATPAPDRPPPLLSDLPEIRAYRALLQDGGTPMDTLTRRVWAITQAAQDLGRRPLEWAVEGRGGVLCDAGRNRVGRLGAA